VSGVRPPAAAGTFYPDDPTELARAVDGLLDAAAVEAEVRPWGIVVPHAGYRYSGPIAATAYAAVRPWAARRVLLLGPAHFVPLEGCAVPRAQAWRTPLGEMAIDDELRAAAIGAGCVADDEPHAPEHAIEVQLPFIQRVWTEPSILPVAVGVAEPSDVAAVLRVAEPDLVVVSTDLSHYLDLEAARAADRRTAEAVVTRDPDAIGPTAACGAFALRGAVAFAREADRLIRLLDLRTSGDTAGDPRRVVGYGAFAIGG
jgi:AmmeMemoRadiSam system protein B